MSNVILSHTMIKAAELARQWLGATSPNPPVGAIALDHEGRIVAAAAHERAGEAHAESLVIAACQKQGLMARLHTLCVTLEPCNHQGRTPPCTEAILAAGFRRIVIGTHDPNPHVKGGGAARLRDAGVEVITGVEESLCRQTISAFTHSIVVGRPWVTVKRALNSEDSMIPPKGQKTFTSPAQLVLAHRLRKRADALLTGSGTILADNPTFTVRHVPDYRNKTRLLAILDRRRRVSAEWTKGAIARGFTPVVYEDLGEALADLHRREIQDVLVEAGPTLTEAVMTHGFWTMEVVLRQNGGEIPDVRFNPEVLLPCDHQTWTLENLLPKEEAILS